MIPTSEHGGFAPEVARSPLVGTGLSSGMQGQGSPLVAGQAFAGMGPPGLQNLRKAQFPGWKSARTVDTCVSRAAPLGRLCSSGKCKTINGSSISCTRLTATGVP